MTGDDHKPEAGNAWAREIAEKICRERNWPCEDPIKVQAGFFRITIRTNADSIGANAIIVLNKKRELIDATFAPR